MPGKKIWAHTALTGAGWAHNVSLTLNAQGHISALQTDTGDPGHMTGTERVGVLLPAPANLHSHAFQQALAGMTEQRGPGSVIPAAANNHDSFWTWRQLMYRFLQHLGPDDVEAISAWVFMQMLQAGYAAVGEFHYLHHQPNGRAYDELSALSQRVAAAAQQTGIGLTLLPVLYQQGGCDGRALNDWQRRFANDTDRFCKLLAGAADAVAQLGADSRTGIAPHSLRAVPAQLMTTIADLAPYAPVHIHVAEQTAEVDEVLQATGQRPVQWVLEHCAVDAHWCLIHATHMTPDETRALAASHAVAGLCPMTEANLGDGIFAGARFVQAGGRFGIGSDSNVRISLSEELRLLEYSQRLRDGARAVLASEGASTGRTLFETAARGGAQALGRAAGKIAPGRLADLVALDAQAIELAGLSGDALLDSFIFAADDRLVTDVWSAGRHVVQQGRHIAHEAITRNYRKTLSTLRAKL